MISVSFIIPVYNTPEVLLRRCIDSILKVIISCDAEIIVVDDGSTHTDVKQVLCEYDSSVRYFRQENRGQAAARNFGLAKATKEYIQFVDSDDYLFAENYLDILNLATEECADLILFSYQNVSTFEPASIVRKGSKVWSGAGEDYLLNNSIFGVIWNCLIRRSSIGGLAFHEGIYHEDEEFAPLVILAAKRMIVTNYICYAYYNSQNSTMTNRDSKHIDRRFRDFCIVIDTLRQESLKMTGKRQVALNRRIDQLCQAFAYIIVKQSPDKEFFKRWSDTLFTKGYLPLPNKKYNLKYSLSRQLTDSCGKLEFAYRVIHLI